MFRKTTLSRVLVVFTVLSLIGLGGCGGDDDDAADDTTTTTAPVEATTTTTQATTTTTQATTTTTVTVDETSVLAEHITTQFAEWKPVIGAEALFENMSDGDTSNDPFVDLDRHVVPDSLSAASTRVQQFPALAAFRATSQTG